MAVDVTERRLAEEDKTRLESQLHQAQKLEGIGRLAGGVAHDFNNLLAVIGNYAQFLEEAVDPGSHLQEDAAEIRRAAERGTALTRQLLVIGRRDAFEFETLDVNEVVSDIERLLRRAVGEETHVVVLRGTELPMARADRGHLEQVLLNLAINARDAMPGAGGTLTISTSSTMVDERTAGALDLPGGRTRSRRRGARRSGSPLPTSGGRGRGRPPPALEATP